ncbi:MAG TPA: hypothetical protein VIC05_10245 [Solirubrobacteraceae bacterium]|jgi:hypothetical protein
MLPFWISIGVLSLVQGSIVALPARQRVSPRIQARRSRWGAVVLPASLAIFVLVARGAERASAQGLTYLALVGVPVLAALSLAWLAHGARPGKALAVPGLFALAWVDRGGLAGQAAAVLLSALSCVALGWLLSAVTPARWLGLGIVAMALLDSALVISDLLQAPNNALNSAHPGAGLPELQSAVFGSAVMGYGDLFIAAVLGGLLAAHATRRRQLAGAALVAVLSVCFDLLLLVVNELPATVPVALALVTLSVRRSGSAGAGIAEDTATIGT